MNAHDELDEYLDNLSEKVRRNVTIVTAEELGQDFMLHISKDTGIPEFIPAWVDNRQNPDEDRSVPRVTVAPTILGCMIGYGEADKDFLLRKADGSPAQAGYKGGWKIYALPFEAALLPGSRLVQDVKNSDEHWLVAYNKETAVYKPKAAGKFFYQKIAYVGQSEKQPLGEATLYVEVVLDEGLRFSKNIHLSKGYWVIDGPVQNNVFSWEDDKDFKVSSIEKTDYLSAKIAVADLLGFSDQVPSYLLW